MLFLLNDVVYRMDPANLALSKAHRSEAAKPLRDVEHKIRKLYATDPRLHRTSPERAALIIKLIIAKLPDVNAAWFGAPAKKCDPKRVRIRYASVDIEVIADVYGRQLRGASSPAIVENLVWQHVPMRRLAATG
jgi:hypothetical protein